MTTTLFTVQEAHDQLQRAGWGLDLADFYRLVKAGDVRSIKLSERRIRIPRAEVDRLCGRTAAV